MNILEDRERAFETKFVHDQEVQFRTVARRNHLLGQWVAQLIGLPDTEADHYARVLVDSTVEKPDLQDLIAQVSNDLDAAGQHLPRRALQEKVDELQAQARQQVFEGGIV